VYTGTYICVTFFGSDGAYGKGQIKPETLNPNDFVFISGAVPTGGRGVISPSPLFVSISLQ
jgi:hypothetical protein